MSGYHNSTFCASFNLRCDCILLKLVGKALCLYDCIYECCPVFLGFQEKFSDLSPVFVDFDFYLIHDLPVCSSRFAFFMCRLVIIVGCLWNCCIYGHCSLTACKGGYSVDMELQLDFALQAPDKKLVIFDLHPVLRKDTRHAHEITCEDMLRIWLTLNRRVLHQLF